MIRTHLPITHPGLAELKRLVAALPDPLDPAFRDSIRNRPDLASDHEIFEIACLMKPRADFENEFLDALVEAAKWGRDNASSISSTKRNVFGSAVYSAVTGAIFTHGNENYELDRSEDPLASLWPEDDYPTHRIASKNCSELRALAVAKRPPNQWAPTRGGEGRNFRLGALALTYQAIDPTTGVPKTAPDFTARTLLEHAAPCKPCVADIAMSHSAATSQATRTQEILRVHYEVPFIISPNGCDLVLVTSLAWLRSLGLPHEPITQNRRDIHTIAPGAGRDIDVADRFAR